MVANRTIVLNRQAIKIAAVKYDYEKMASY